MKRRREKLDIDPATLRGTAFTFSLKKKSVSLDDFERFVHEVRAALNSVSRAATLERGDWFLTDLRYGSAIMSCAPSPSLNGRRELVEAAIIDGFRAVESASAKPSYFPDRALSAIRKLSIVADEGSMVINAPDGREASLTSLSGKNVDLLLRPVRRYFGSLLGNLDVVSVHKRPFVTVYSDHGDVVRCYLPPALIDDAKEFLGKRVIVTGTINANRLGNMISILGDQLFEAPRRHKSPPSESAGSIPDFTGGLSTTDFLHENRGELLSSQ